MSLPDRVKEAIHKEWNITAEPSEQVMFQELTDDWIVWQKQDAGKAGGLRLVVPKWGSQTFEIPSSAFADDKHGVSWEYQIVVSAAANPSREAAEILARHTDLTRMEAFRLLRSPSPSSHTCFIAAPLAMRAELQAVGTASQLLRPNDRGGYL